MLNSRVLRLAPRIQQLCRCRSQGAGGRLARAYRVVPPPPPPRWHGAGCGLVLATSWFTTLTLQSDCDQVDFDTLVKNKIIDEGDQQTGWDRLAAMYTLDEMGGLTPELESVTSMGVAGLLCGGALGGLLNGRLAVIKFIERNQATSFESPIVAKRALQDRVLLGMFRGFFIIGWRAAVFSSAFGLTVTTLMVYSNSISALHFAAAGGVAGALYKLNMGLRGMAAGALAGTLLGLTGGCIISLMCVVTGITLPDLRCQQYIWKHRQELRMRAYSEKKRLKEKQTKEEQDAGAIPTVVSDSATVASNDHHANSTCQPSEPQSADVSSQLSGMQSVVSSQLSHVLRCEDVGGEEAAVVTAGQSSQLSAAKQAK